MANEQIKKNYKDIANAIRSKTGENGLISAEEMPAKIESIETGITPEGSLDITANGNNIDVATKASVNVNVPVGVFPSGSLDITANANNIDVTNKASVNVNVPSPQPSGTVDITYNGTHTVSGYAYADVNVATWDTIDDSDYAVQFIEEVIEDSNQKTNRPFVTDTGSNIDPSTEHPSLSLSIGLHLQEPDVYEHPVDLYRVPGYHSFSGDNCIVIGGLGFPYHESQDVWNFEFYVTYYDYSGYEYSESEIEDMWRSAFSDIELRDLEGNTLGTLDTYNASIQVSFQEGC